MEQNVRPGHALMVELVRDWLRANGAQRQGGLLLLMDDAGGFTRKRRGKLGLLWLNTWVERIQSRIPPVQGFILSVMLATLAFYSRYIWFDSLENRYPFLMGIPVVVITAGLFGAGPAMGAAIAGVLLPAYYLMEPRGTLWVADPVDAFGAMLYLGISILVAITVCALSSAKALAVEYALERRRLHREVENLLHELRHRTKNELMQLLALTHMMMHGSEGQDAREALAALAGRIRAVGHVHDMLSEVMDKPETPVDSGVFLTGLLDKIISAVGRSGVAMSIRTESHPLRHTIAVPLGIILNELIMNALKHAFPSGTGTIKVVFRREDADYVLVVQDNGVGRGACAGDLEAKPRRRGLGQRVISGFARSLEGVIQSINNEEPGMCCELRFPVKSRRA